jgi:hypothetical protein
LALFTSSCRRINIPQKGIADICHGVKDANFFELFYRKKKKL